MVDETTLPAPSGSQLRATKVRVFDSAAPFANYAVPLNDIMASSAVGFYPEATAQVPKGLAVDTDSPLNPGSGGTDGVFDAVWSGGNFTVNPKARFKVRNGRVDWFKIDGPGLCVNASPSAPTVSLSASAGLTGASIPLKVEALVPSGSTWWGDHASDVTLWQLYRNNAGAAAALSGRTEPKNVATALATEVAAAQAARTGAEAARDEATGVLGDLIEAQYAVGNVIGDLIEAQYAVGNVIGVASPGTGTAYGSSAFAMDRRAAHRGLLRSVSYAANAGSIAIQRFTKSGDVFTQVDAGRTVTLSAGVGSVAIDPPIAVSTDQYLGFTQSGSVVHYKAAGEPTANFYSGTLSGSSFTDSTMSTTYPPQIRFDVEYPAVTVERLDAVEDKATTLDAQKAPMVPALAPPSYRNAIRYRYGSSASVQPFTYYQTVPTAVYSADVYAAYGEPNVIRCTAAPASADYKPETTIVVLPEDLARIGIVPNDSTPPLMSARAAILLANLVNQSISTTANDGYGQVSICLRYNDADATAATGFSAAYQDVVFPNAVTGCSASYYVPSPNPFAGVTGRLLPDTARLKGYAREGIPVLATLNGKALSKVMIKVYGRNLAAGAVSMDVARLALVAGATIDDNDNYLSPSELQESIGSASVTAAKKVTIGNSDKIVVAPNSYSESYWTVAGKPWQAKVSAYTDYLFETHAVSGETFVENLNRLRTASIIYGNKAMKDFGTTYALALGDATNAPFYGTYAHWLDNARAWAESVRGAGATPILATEFLPGKFGGEYQLGLKPIADANGGLFWDILPDARNFDIQASRDPALWGQNHPGTRTNVLISAPITRKVKTLPRPRRALKIFRKRPGVAVPSLDALRFAAGDHHARHVLFQEIHVGHKALKASHAGYVDDLASAPALADANHETINSEYLKIQSGVAVSFADYCLIDAILDGTQQSVDWAALVISDPNATVYVYDVLATPYETSTRYQRFELTGAATVAVGDVYTTSDGSMSPTSFTVVGKVGNDLIMSPMEGSRLSKGAGTLTRTSGTGSASIPYTMSQPGYDPDYYSNLGQPEGHWVAVAGDGTGRFKVSDLRGKLVFDRIRFLIYKSGGFSLTKCEIEYDGVGGKPAHPVPSLARPRGAIILAEAHCGTAGELSAFTVVGSLTAGKVAGDNSGTPLGTTGYVTVTAVNRLRKALTFTASTDEARPALVTLKCRYFPAMVNSGTYPTGASITPDSVDFRQIEVSLIDGPITAPSRAVVGLWWQTVEIPVEIPAGSTSLTLDVGGVTDGVQVAAVAVQFMN